MILDGPGIPFDVRGLALHYRPPLNWIVDELTPHGDREVEHVLPVAATVTVAQLHRRDKSRDSRLTDLEVGTRLDCGMSPRFGHA